MVENRSAELEWAEIEDCINRYLDERRLRIEPFINAHFSFKETVRLQKRSLVLDLLLHPLNALWVIPYLGLKNIGESCEKLGWGNLVRWTEKLPPCFKTGYQREVERLIATELFNAEHGLLDEIKRNPKLSHLVDSGDWKKFLMFDKELKKELDKFSAGRAVVSDLAASATVLFLGWYFFGDKSLGVSGLGEKFAGKWARDRAVSNFALGENIGSAFYSVFPAHASKSEVFWATAMIGVLLVFVSVACGVLSDPLRKRLGLHEHKLNSIINNFGDSFLLASRKRFKAIRIERERSPAGHAKARRAA